MDDILKAVISAVIAYVVPRALGSIGKTFSPSQDVQNPLPWVQWCVASFIGGALGGALSGAIGDQGFGNWAVYGAALGIMQWFALRGYLPVSGWWALASTIGWATFPIGGVWGWAVAGSMIGILQTIGLKADGKGWWIGGNLVAWTLVGAIGLVIGGPIIDTFGIVLGWIIGWGLGGLIGALLLLLPLSHLTPRAQGTA